MKIQMIAAKAFAYAGKRLKAGDDFAAHGAGDARLLRAIGNAIDAAPKAPEAPEPVVVAAPKREYARKDFFAVKMSFPAAETPAADKTAAAEVEQKPKRQYRRRDMAAE